MFDLSGFFEFTDEELNNEINSIEIDLNTKNDIRTLYCYLSLLKKEKERRENEKIQK